MASSSPVMNESVIVEDFGLITLAWFRLYLLISEVFYHSVMSVIANFARDVSTKTPPA